MSAPKRHLTFTSDSAVGNTVEVACDACQRHTEHRILKSIKEQGQEPWDPYNDYYWTTDFEIIQCGGCRTVSFRVVTSDSETADPEGDPLESEYLYPSRGRKPLNDMLYLPSSLQRIYKETIGALNSDQPVLCGIGIRAVIETITKDKNATGHNLEDKIDGLVKIGVLTASGAKVLHNLRTLGNKAAHEVKAHTTKELSLALDVVDNLLDAVYVLPVKAQATFK